MSQATGEPLHCPVQGAADQISVIDPIGAGDTFIAGMLWRCFVAGDWPSVNVESAVSFAVALATLKVQQDGFAGLKESLANEVRSGKFRKEGGGGGAWASSGPDLGT